jgi:GTP-binding protein
MILIAKGLLEAVSVTRNHHAASSGSLQRAMLSRRDFGVSTWSISSTRGNSGLQRLQQRYSQKAVLALRVATTASQQIAGNVPALVTLGASSSCAMRFRTLSSSAASFTGMDGGGEEEDNVDYVTTRRTLVRNVAVIAHVDHGKTTLVDQLLKAGADNANTLATERLMDSGDLEKERGITITSKVTRIVHSIPSNHRSDTNDTNNNGDDDQQHTRIVINCADTPGHSDFSGEVDRFLSLSDGFVLVVDAAEGPKSQTKYVLSRALALQLQPIVVLNKCDRPDAIARIDSGETEAKLAALFAQLSSSSSPPDYLTLYASAREGWVTDDPLTALELTDTGLTNPDEHGMKRLLDAIWHQIPEPAVRSYQATSMTAVAMTDTTVSHDDLYFANDKFSMAAVTVGNDKYLGRTCTGRIYSGSVGPGDAVAVLPRLALSSDAAMSSSQSVSGLFVYKGISRTPLEGRAYAGDIVTLTGVPESIAVGDTVTGHANPVPIPIATPPLAPPTLCMDFGANDGPFAGKEGTIVASSKIRDRLLFETDNNVTLKVEVSSSDAEKTVVYARGELQLGILIEQMRREGFEMIISPPRILTKTCPQTGKTLEPYEEVVVDVDSEYAGAVISALTGDRRGVLLEMSESTADGKSQLILEVPSRGLLGFNSEIATATKGSAVVNHLYIDDREQQGLGVGLTKGKLVSNDSGKATGYALSSLQARGTLFIEPGDMIYPGMVIGESSKPGDLEVNAVRAKEKTNMRTQLKDEKVTLPPPKRMSVEDLIGYMGNDEVIEITPKSIRLRKLLLDAGERERANRNRQKQMKSLKENNK